MNERKKIMFEIEKFSNMIENNRNLLNSDKNLEISNFSDVEFMISSNVNNFKTERETIDFNFITDQVGHHFGNSERGEEKSEIPVENKHDLVQEKTLVQKDEEMNQEISEEINKNFSKQNQVNFSISFSSQMNKNSKGEKSPTVIEQDDINRLNFSFQSSDNLKEISENRADELKEVNAVDKNISSEMNKEADFNDKYNQGRWSADEHLKFIEAMWLYGNEWKKVQTHIGSRTSSQARSHAQKFFIRLKKKFTTSGMNKVMDVLNEENFGIIIDWINESLDANHMFLNCKNV